MSRHLRRDSFTRTATIIDTFLCSIFDTMTRHACVRGVGSVHQVPLPVTLPKARAVRLLRLYFIHYHLIFVLKDHSTFS